MTKEDGDVVTTLTGSRERPLYENPNSIKMKVALEESFASDMLVLLTNL